MKGTTNAQTVGGTVGDATHPIYLSNGRAVAVASPFLSKLPAARCSTVSNNIAKSTVTAMTFSNNYTNDNDTVTASNGIVTTKKAGLYLIIGSMKGNVTAATRVQIGLKRDGSSEYCYQTYEITITNEPQGVQYTQIINETTPNHTYQLEIWLNNSAMSTANGGAGAYFYVVYLG